MRWEWVNKLNFNLQLNCSFKYLDSNEQNTDTLLKQAVSGLKLAIFTGLNIPEVLSILNRQYLLFEWMAWFLNIDLTELIYWKIMTFGEGEV